MLLTPCEGISSRGQLLNTSLNGSPFDKRGWKELMQFRVGGYNQRVKNALATGG